MTFRISRRTVLAAGLVFMASPMYADTTQQLIGSKKLSVEEAYDLAANGAITLVDIRRPDEWAATGVGEGAKPLDMRRKDFVAELDLFG